MNFDKKMISNTINDIQPFGCKTCYNSCKGKCAGSCKEDCISGCKTTCKGTSVRN